MVSHKGFMVNREVSSFLQTDMISEEFACETASRVRIY